MSDCGCGGGPENCTTKNIIENVIKYTPIVIVTVITAIYAEYYKIYNYTINFFSENKDKESIIDNFVSLECKYIPASKFFNEHNFSKIMSKKIIEGDKNNNSLKSISSGSFIFPGEGLNIAQGNIGQDKFYYSLCSTKIMGYLVNEILDFETNKDKISIFCTKRIIEKNQVKILFNKKYPDYSFIEVENLNNEDKEPTVIAINNPNISFDDIILNDHKFKDDVKLFLEESKDWEL